MAGLLRIQPQIPSGSPGVNVPQNAWQSVGKGLSEFAEHLQKQEDAADTLAATRALGEASAGIDGAVKIAATKTNNPDEFQTLATEGVSSIHLATRDGLTSERARARYDALIADNLGKAKTAIALGAHGKMVANARGDIDLTEKQILAGIAASNDPAERKALIDGRGFVIGRAQAGGILTQKEVQDKNLKFEQDVLFNDTTKRVANGQGYRELADIYSGKYDSQPREFREQLKNIVTGGLADIEKIQKKGKEVDVDKWSLEFIDLLSASPSDRQIKDKLREGKVVGLSDGEYRAWEARAKTDLTTDTPEQLSNKDKFLADFRLRGDSRVNAAKAKKELDDLYREGRIGNKGRAEIAGALSQSERYLTSQERMDERIGRADDKDPLGEAKKELITIYPKRFDGKLSSADQQEYNRNLLELNSRAGSLAGDNKEKPSAVLRDIAQRVKQRQEKDKVDAERKSKEKAEKAKVGVSPEKLNAIQGLIK